MGLKPIVKTQLMRWRQRFAAVAKQHPRNEKEQAMEDHVYRSIEISGSSQTSIEDAIQTAVSRAGRTRRNLRWSKVLHTRGHLEGGKNQLYQGVMKIGSTIDESTIGAFERQDDPMWRKPYWRCAPT